MAFWQRSKAKNKLGMDAKDVITQAAQTGGHISCKEFDAMWEIIQEDEDFLAGIIAQLLKLLYEKLNVKNNKEGFANKGETIKQCNRCINMLSMLSLSVDEIPNTPKIVNRLGRLEEKSLSDGIRLLAHGNTIISHYNKRVKEGVIPFDNLTINCVNLYDHEQLVEIGDRFRSPQLRKILRGDWSKEAAHVFAWDFMLQRTRGEALNTVWITLINQANALKGMKTVLETLAEITLYAILHMTIQLLPYAKTGNIDLLDQMLQRLLPYQFWPSPQGTNVQNVIHSIRAELCAPGVSWIQQVLQESEYPSMYLDNQKFRLTHYFVDPNDRLSIRKQSVMLLNSEPAQSQYLVGLDEEDRVRLIATALRDIQPLTSEELTGLNSLSDEQINEIWDELIQAYQDAKNDEIENKIVNHKINELKERIKSIKGPGNNYNVSEIYELPGFQHIILPVSLRKDDVQFPEEIAIVQGNQVFPVSEAFKHLHNKLTSFMGFEQGEKLKVKFVIAGGNRLLHAVMTAYAALLRDDSELASNFDISFYIVPFSTNWISEHIARHDAWYARHILIPFFSNTWTFPSMKLDDPNEITNYLKGTPHMFGTAWRRLVENYVTEAGNMLHVRLWEVECWKDTSQGSTPQQVLVFGEFLQMMVEQGDEDSSVLVRCKNVDFEGNFWYEDEIALQDVAHLRCNNVTGQAGEPVPDPTNKWLDVYIMYRKSRNKTNEHRSVQEIELTMETPFTIRLDGDEHDGEVYGPYYRVKVKPLLGPEVDPQSPPDWLSFPVATYFPISLL